jgi:peroxiredoxin Q/BCP
LRRDHEKFVERDTEILSIGPEAAEAFRAYWEKEDLPFVGLADPDHVVAERYGQPVRLLRLGRLPMQLLIDPSGVVRSRHEGGWMSDIPANRAVLEELDRIREARGDETTPP